MRGALFILPFIALGGYTMIALLPMLAVVRMAKILENSTDYSIQNTTRHALFLPTSREAKYKAKQAIDSFFWRAGDLLQAGVVFVGTMLAFNVSTTRPSTSCSSSSGSGSSSAIAREHRKLCRRNVRRKRLEACGGNRRCRRGARLPCRGAGHAIRSARAGAD